MPLFNRNHNAPVNGANGHTNGHHHNEKAHYSQDFYGRRPPFGQWLKATALDLITMVCMGLLGLGIYEAHPAANRSFPITFQDGQIVYPEFA
jgi:diacylglycerol diphosphate phosphatase / phosphatidate phosphatase